MDTSLYSSIVQTIRAYHLQFRRPENTVIVPNVTTGGVVVQNVSPERGGGGSCLYQGK